MGFLARRIYGVETEYGLTALRRADDGSWTRLGAEDAASALFAPFASGRASTNVFLPGGGRLYLDVGHHPEYATPECDCVDDLLVAERAGDELMVELASLATAREAQLGRETRFRLVKNNLDSFGNTYGSHENYLIDRSTDLDALTAWLVPFLVARQAIAGAGRWHRGTFTIAQRGDVLGDIVSGQTTRQRPLINARDEPHADPGRYRRLHVISGDSNLDETTAWLRYGATELVLRLAESGRPAPLTLDDPLASLRAFGRDPDAAADVLAVYADAAGDVADGLDDVLAAWRGGITPEWAHKRTLIEGYRDRHGLPDDDPRLDALDLRWHEIGPDGPGERTPRGFARLLETRGVLARRTAPDAVARAHTQAPSPTRARDRGRLAAVLDEHGRDASLDWSKVVVHDLPATVTLDDPFALDDPQVSDVIARLAGQPRRRGFRPPAT